MGRGGGREHRDSEREIDRKEKRFYIRKTCETKCILGICRFDIREILTNILSNLKIPFVQPGRSTLLFPVY